MAEELPLFRHEREPACKGSDGVEVERRLS
jgi:hypothetical protein